MNTRIMNVLYRCVAIFLLCISLAACRTGYKLGILQSDFERLYISHLEMEKNSYRPGWSGVEDIQLALRGVSLEAKKAAETVDVEDPSKVPTKIAFLRLAMIAAWQGKEETEGYMKSIVNEGKSLCEKLAPKEPTRDCALFLIVPTAILSSKFSESSEANLMNTMDDDHFPPDKEPEVVEFFNSMKEVLQDALSKFTETPLQNYLSRHQRLLDYYYDELKRYRIRLGTARVYAFKVEGKPEGVITTKEEKFAICAEKWIEEIKPAKLKLLSEEQRIKAQKCLYIVR